MRPLVLALLLLAPAAAAQSLAEKLDGARTAAQVRLALADDEVLAPFPFDARMQARVLLLTGRVETAAQKARAEEVAEAVPGVGSIVNEVRVEREAAAAGADLPPVTSDAATPEPEATEPAPAPEPTYHTVRSGDTLGAIARRYGTTVRELRRLNGIRGSNIRVGQRLRVE